jgi:AcrR family transcriptional regulator
MRVVAKPPPWTIGFDISFDTDLIVDTVSITDYRSAMSYIAERRVEEKERRRTEILDAAEALYAKQGWESLTMEQVARGARLSRALVYVYYRDKQELLFAIGERAMGLLGERFIAAAAGQKLGIDKIEAIGRAYTGFAFEFPHYFDFISRFNAHSTASDPGSHAEACKACGDEVIQVVVEAIQTGISDGSLRQDIGDPTMMAVSLWAFTHGLIQLTMAKGSDMARLGLGIAELSAYGFDLLRRAAQSRLSPTVKT